MEGNPLNTYRRNGEGDYRCTEEELRAMYRDASYKTQDMLGLEEMGLDVFCYESMHRYRNRLLSYRPGHVWGECFSYNSEKKSMTSTCKLSGI